MIQRILFFLLIMASISACKKETIQIDELSKDVKVYRRIAIPLLETSMSFEETAGREADSSIFSNGDSIKLFFPMDFSLKDTMEIQKTGQNMKFDYFKLYHNKRNMFPIGLDIDLILHNSERNINLDTFPLKDSIKIARDLPLIEPAVIGSNNMVDTTTIFAVEESLELDSSFFNLYYDSASHIIITFTLQQTSDTLRILDHYRLDLDLSIDAAGYMIIEEEADTTQTTAP